MRALNSELAMLSWSIGRDILEQQQTGGWGDEIVGRIAEDLRATTGGARGFSRSNVFYMRKFAALWPDPEKVQTLSGQSVGLITRRCWTPLAGSPSCTRGMRGRLQ